MYRRERWTSDRVRDLQAGVMLSRRIHALVVVVLLISTALAPATASAWQPILHDPDLPQLSSEIFPLDPALEPAVRFWAQLFSRHDSTRVILHDRQNLDIIWQVLDLKGGDEGPPDPIAFERIVREASETLRARLKRLELDPTPQNDEDRVILSLAGGQDPARLTGAWMRVRAQRGVADKFREGVERAKPYLAEMQQKLLAEGLPAQIAALPFVESMFNTSARSYAGAAGVWQLMPATARGLGLKVTRTHDERLDVLKATHAAARMLKKNFQMLGTWPLAITAYNHGPNGLSRAVSEMGSTDLVYLIDNYEKATWGFASKNFYAEFLAAVTVLAQKSEEFAALVSPSLAILETTAPAEPTKKSPPTDEASTQIR